MGVAKSLILFIISLSFIKTSAQAPPAIEWQKCIGGNNYDAINAIQPLADGGFILAGQTSSNDGDITHSNGAMDAWIINLDNGGNVLWQKNYGGTHIDIAIDIKLTADSGYVFLGTTSSTDGDVSGNHGGTNDIWLVKLDATGNIQWQKCYGGPGQETSHSLQLTNDGGYIIGAYVTADGGDIAGHHGNNNANDVWIVKTDSNGNMEWQKCYGGSQSDDITSVIPTTDGGYIFSASVLSTDGDVNCAHYSNQDIWLVKIDNDGNIEWQSCAGGNYGEVPDALLQSRDGGYIIAGIEYSDDLPGTHGPGGDGWVVKFDSNGNIEWQRFLGGTQTDRLQTIIETNDGYVVAGSSNSTDGDICSNKGTDDLFIVKLNTDGSTAWKRTCGGTKNDGANAVVIANDGGFLVSGFANSNDGDVSGNHNPNVADAWLVKLSFPGIDILPTIAISADETTICPGKNISFSSSITNGGTQALYQWRVNGQSFSNDSASTNINTLKDGDLVNCVLTSNSNCVTSATAISNNIAISLDTTLTPTDFLPASLQVCSYGNLEIKPTGTYKTYWWSTDEHQQNIIVNHPGVYWLQVTNEKDCPGKDSVLVTAKDCLIGFFMPTAFTPNNDGKNDLFKPVIGGVVSLYKLIIYNRWGQTVFQTATPSKGWDGKTAGSDPTPQVYIWTCTYQLQGEPTKTERGTVTLIR